MPSPIKSLLQTLAADPLVWLVLLGFCLPFVLQMGWFPFQKLSMFSEDPAVFTKWSGLFKKL